MTEYLVEKVIGKRVISNIVYYKIKWEGYSIEESTWEPISNLNNITHLIDEWERENLASTKENNENQKKGFVLKNKNNENKNDESFDSKSEKKETYEVIEQIGNRSPISITGAKGINGKIYCLVNFENKKKGKSNSEKEKKFVPSSVMKDQHPKLLIEFYESKIKFINKTK